MKKFILILIGCSLVFASCKTENQDTTTATDTAGNEGPSSEALIFTVDTQATAAPSLAMAEAASGAAIAQAAGHSAPTSGAGKPLLTHPGPAAPLPSGNEEPCYVFKYFESRLPPYPPAEPHLPPKDFMAFVWDGTRGLRGYVAAMAGLSAAIAIYEALLFAVLGHVVDWLSTVAPHALWAEHKGAILGIVALLIGTLVLVSWQTSLKHQVLAINFPLRLRWNFHRLMLGQSMAFYADEFAGRITTKIMQTALAVRDMIFTTTDVVIGMGIYLVTILVLLAGFDARLLAPFAAWMVAYGLACWYFVPRLGKVGKAQADARSVMTGRITDAYTNITTVKLFSHSKREAHFARAAMEDFKQTGFRQMRLVSQFEIVNQALVVGLIHTWMLDPAAFDLAAEGAGTALGLTGRPGGSAATARAPRRCAACSMAAGSEA